MTSPVPAVATILKYLKDENEMHLMDCNIDVPVRAKKRRLDHLTWEEKMQRKKLKNRVAAQTSRDRKKAKAEQMEKAIQDLFAKNEAMLAECENLKNLNKRLVEENAELNKKLAGPCRSGHTFSSSFGQRTDSGPLEDCSGLPSLPDLLDELNCDVDVSSLEQLTQSLLQDIAKDLEAAAQKTDYEESKANRVTQVVGQTSAELESTGSASIEEKEKCDKKTVEDDLSQFLLLHHNYSAKPPSSPKVNTKSSLKSPQNTLKAKRLKHIRPKISPQIFGTSVNTSTPVVPVSITPMATEEVIPDCEVLVGSADDASNCITIYVNEDGSCVNETGAEVVVGEDTDISDDVSLIQESLPSNDLLTVPSSKESGNSSPLSDNGYESLGSPIDNDDLWNESVSELFPSLL